MVHSLRVQSHTGVKAWWLEQEVAGQRASATRKQREGMLGPRLWAWNLLGDTLLGEPVREFPQRFN